MNIKRDLSDLPTREVPDPNSVDRQSNADLWPSTEPTLGPLLAEAWFAQRTHDDNLAHAMPDAGFYRGSYAASCSRQIWYKMTGVEETDSNSIADHWRMDLGSLVHEGLQSAISEVMPRAEHEVKVNLNSVGLAGSMHIDSVNFLTESVCETVEIKTINGFGYKTSVTTMKGGPHGPRESAVVQAALGACAYQEAHPELFVSGARIVYLALENIAPSFATKIGLGGEVGRFCSEWFIPLAQCKVIVQRERDRIDVMIGQHTNGEWVDPIIPLHPLETDRDPVKIRVKNPKTGAAVTNGGAGASSWQCNYCSHQSQCIQDHEVAK